MIIKTKIGKSFGGCVRYLLGKENAEILHAEGVSVENAQQMTEDFNHTRKINPDLGNAVWHASVSFAPEDKGKVSEGLMEEIAQDYANKFKLEQYAVIRHHDKGHEHFHIIANRVGYEGNTISDQFCASRGVELAKQLEVKYELTQAQEKGKNLGQTNEKALHGHDKTKYEVYKEVKKEMEHCRTFDELKEALKDKGINVELKTQSTGRAYGVSFSKGKECFKGSEVDKTMSFGNLQKTMGVNIKKAIDNKVEKATEKTIEKTLGNINPIVKGISIVKDIGKALDKGFGR
jgi:hypothetical protein